MKYPSVLAGIGVAGLAALCRCSLFVDVNGLEDAGPATQGPDATAGGGGDDAAGGDEEVEATDEAPGAAGDDGENIEAAGGDEGGDAPGVGNDDSGRSDAAGDQGVLDAGATEAAPIDAPSEGAIDTGVRDAGDAGAPDAPADGPSDSAVPDAPSDSGDSTLVAYYPFDESTGATSVDATGNGHTATMHGATFSTGIQGNAAAMNGTTQYVALPAGIVDGLMSFTVSAWFYLNDGAVNTRVFDFGSGPTTYMFVTPAQIRFAISTSGFGGEQGILGPTAPLAAWQHVAVTGSGTTGTLYVNGVAQSKPNTNMTLRPASLGATTQNWLGRSQYTADPYLNGKIDNLRIYSRALSAAEVMQLYTTKQ